MVLAILIALLCCAVFTIFTEAHCCRMPRACALRCLESSTYLGNIYTSVKLEFELEVMVVWKDVPDAEAGAPKLPVTASRRLCFHAVLYSSP